MYRDFSSCYNQDPPAQPFGQHELDDMEYDLVPETIEGATYCTAHAEIDGRQVQWEFDDPDVAGSR